MSLLNDWADKAYENSHAHGFWSDLPDTTEEIGAYLGNKLMLIVGEVAEAHECLRDNLDTTFHWVREDGKPEGFAFELADVMIRLFDLAGALDINLDAVVRLKMEFNESRPIKHGKHF